MEFSLSKELRTLGVVEFVLLFVSTVSSVECCGVNLSCYNIDFIGLIITALEMSVYITFLVLFRRDVRVCDDPLITTVIILATCILALRLLAKIFDWLLTKLFERKKEEVDPEAVTANAVGSFTGKGFEMLEKFDMEKFDKWFSVLQKSYFLIFPLMFIFILAALAWAIFSFATTIKLAIPGDFEASCVDSSGVSKAIMLGLPVGTIAVYLSIMCVQVGVSWHNRNVNLAEVNLFSLAIKQSLVNAAVILPTYLALVVLSIMLFTRLVKVWRGEELELYEYVALSVCTPLLPFTSGSSEEETQSGE